MTGSHYPGTGRRPTFKSTPPIETVVTKPIQVQNQVGT